jgi:hypothetical protein
LRGGLKLRVEIGDLLSSLTLAPRFFLGKAAPGTLTTNSDEFRKAWGPQDIICCWRRQRAAALPSPSLPCLNLGLRNLVVRTMKVRGFP